MVGIISRDFHICILLYTGTNRYPLSQYTFNKSVEDRRRLKDDLDRLFGSDSLESLPSPFYAIDASKESNHSGESPLFEHRLLAPSRVREMLTNLFIQIFTLF